MTTGFMPLMDKFVDSHDQFSEASVAEPGVDVASIGINFSIGDDGNNVVQVSHINGELQGEFAQKNDLTSDADFKVEGPVGGDAPIVGV